MSGSIQSGIIRKSEAAKVISGLKLSVETDPWTLDQFEEAKDVALLLLKSVPGPHITVVMNGHANGLGYHGREGWSADFVNVSVNQVIEYKADPDKAKKPSGENSVTAVLKAKEVTNTGSSVTAVLKAIEVTKG
jgi:hypothetical protein